MDAELVAKWRSEAVHLERSIDLWRSCKLRASMDGKDVTEQHVAELTRIAAALREAADFLNR